MLAPARFSLTLLLFISPPGGVAAFTPATPLSPRAKWIHEAEKKHERVALLGLPSLAAISAANHGMDPVPWLSHQPVETQIIFFSMAALFETFNLRRFDRGFTLKPGEEPGRLFFKDGPPPAPNLLLAEENAGRVAMVVSFLLILESTLSRSVG